MKKATANIVELSDRLLEKYAKSQDMKCKCEHSKCKTMELHEPGHCNGKSTGKGCMYLGPICEQCAQFLDPQYLIDLE